MLARLATLLLLPAAQVAAQGVRVRVVEDQGSRPIAGALVTLRLGGQTALERVTNAEGVGVIAAPATTGYSLLVQRVGHRPFESPKFALPLADTQGLTIRVPELTALLPAPASIPARPACVAGVAGRDRTGVVWEQARIALAAAEIIRGEALQPMAIRRFERTLDRQGEVRAEAQVDARTHGTRPFRVAPAGELSRRGYAVTDSTGEWQFLAPDASTLLSDEFAADHCFGVVAGSGATDGMLGLSFKPVAGRRVTDVEGVLWVDAESGRLRFAQFSYLFPQGLEARDVGGRLHFEQLVSANWIAREWVLRTPVLTRLGQVLGYREEGGEAMELTPRMIAMLDSIQNAKRPPGIISGVVWDSLAKAGFAGATVWLDSSATNTRTDARGTYFLRGVPPGQHVVHFTHPSLDSLGIFVGGTPVMVESERMVDVNLAGPSLASLKAGACADSAAILTGTVRDAATNAPADSAFVTLTWISILFRPRESIKVYPGDVTVVTDTSGQYAACVPPYLEITGLARRGPARTGRVDVRMADRGLTILNFLVDRDATDSTSGTAILRGIVKYQDGAPLRGATVMLTDPERSTVSDSMGHFRLHTVPAGTRVVDTRAIGHAPARSVVDLRPGDTSEVIVYLRKVTTLDPIIVQAAASDKTADVLASIEERRHRGMGYRLRTGELNAFKGQRVDAVMRALPFSQTRQTAEGPRVFLQSQQGQPCQPQIWLDGHRSMFEVVEGLMAKDLLAIEVFPRLAQVPSEYRDNTGCGVILIWMRGVVL